MAFKIDPAPTFREPVTFRLPGGKVAVINVDFKFYDEAGRDDLRARLRGKSDPECAMELATGWDAEASFSEESVAELFRTYPTSAKAFFRTYNEAIYGAEAKN